MASHAWQTSGSHMQRFEAQQLNQSVSTIFDNQHKEL